MHKDGRTYAYPKIENTYKKHTKSNRCDKILNKAHKKGENVHNKAQKQGHLLLFGNKSGYIKIKN